MAHLAKFGKAAYGRLYAHWAREKDAAGEYVTYKTEKENGGHIHRERTNQNYAIGEVRSKSWAAERLKNVYQKPGQKHPPYVCDIVVTLPRSESLDRENVEKFMRAAYDSLMKQYGKYNNVVGAFVHLDEAQPHLHFAFLPISPRKSRQKPEYVEKLSTRAYWSRKNALQIMHQQLQRDISAALGHKVEITNAATKAQGGNKTVQQLKAETVEIQKHIEKIKSNKKDEIDTLIGEHKTPIVGDEYYKLSVHEYKRLRTLATMSIQQNAEYERMKAACEKLEHENEALRLQRRNYKSEVVAEYEKKLRDVENERDQLRQEAAPWFSVPEQMREVVTTALESLCRGYHAACNSLCVTMLDAFRRCKNAQRVIDVAAPALRRLTDGTESVTDDYREYVKQLDIVEQRKSPFALATGWKMLRPEEIDFSLPINKDCVQAFLGDAAHCIDDLRKIPAAKSWNREL